MESKIFREVGDLRKIKNFKISVKEVTNIVQKDYPDIMESNIQDIFDKQDAILNEDFELEQRMHSYYLEKGFNNEQFF